MICVRDVLYIYCAKEKKSFKNSHRLRVYERRKVRKYIYMRSVNYRQEPMEMEK